MQPTPIPAFAHLHIRSAYSLYQSTINTKTRKLLDRANALQLHAIAVTDVGSLAGSMECHLKGKRQGVKSIVGATITVSSAATLASPAQVILLCENLTGYRNLCQIVSRRNVTKSFLAKHTDGLIALSGGLYGEINHLCRLGRDHEAALVAQWLSETFPERFFIELHPPCSPTQGKLNQQLRIIATSFSIPTVATAPCHFLLKEEREALAILRKLGNLTPLPEFEQRAGCDLFWLMSAEEITAMFADDPQAIAQSRYIADLCRLEMGDETALPFSCPEISTGNPDDELRRQVYKGLAQKQISPKPLPRYQERVEHELDIIRQAGLSVWFLHIARIVGMAREAGISIGPGTGRYPASLVSYCLGISDVDPLVHGLIFERFINPERYRFPDFFISVPINRRNELIDLIADRYGHDRVILPSTYDCLEGRNLVRRLGKLLGVEEERVEQIVPQCQEHRMPRCCFVSNLCDNLEVQTVVAHDSRLAELVWMAKTLDRLPCKGSPLHNEIILTSEPLAERLPLRRMGSIFITDYAAGTIGGLGLPTLYLDGYKALVALERLERLKGIDTSQIPFDDPDTWRLISSGKTSGIFELDTRSMKKVLRRVKPECFADLAAAYALNRLGPVDAGMLDEFIRRRHDSGWMAGLSPLMSGILEETRGVIVYQEQIMEIAHRVAGYSYAEAELLLRILVRQDAPNVAGTWEQFREKADSNGCSHNDAETVFSMISAAAPHTYLKSHTVGWMMLSYRMAYGTRNN